jgi:uncharacterized membrane protein
MQRADLVRRIAAKFISDVTGKMGKQRLEAFTDGVLAIVITIMVLDLRVPTGGGFVSLVAGFPVLFAYALSFVNVGIFWNNHHHMLHATERINGTVLWANMLLLFWLSLVPFVIRWMDETHFAAAPTASYGVVLALAALSYMGLERAIIACNGPESKLAKAVGEDVKAKVSMLLYTLGIALAFVRPGIAITAYVLVAALWFIPDRRIESVL